MSKVQNNIHIIFNTLSRKRTISEESQEALYRYITRFCKSKKVHIYQVNGTTNHVHLLRITICYCVNRFRQGS